MDEIIKYGDLSDAELYEFLRVIEADDDDMLEAEENADSSIIDEEECLPDEMLDDKAWTVSKRWEKTEDGRYKFVGLDYHLKSDKDETFEQRREAWNARRREALSKKAKDSSALRKQRKIDINREAFRQNDIMLSDNVSTKQLKQLIASLTNEHKRMIDKLFTYINKRVNDLLRPLIPRALRICAERYPHSIVTSPGFMYKASNEYGENKLFWVTLNVPYYFQQGTEQDILIRNKPEFLYSIDKAIVQYYYHKCTLAEKEVKYATALVNKRIKTYFDLLKYNPFWFAEMYKLLTGKTLCTTDY